MSINIQKNTSYNSTTSLKNRTISYIIIHYTAGTTSKSGTAWNTCEWFKNKNASGSADFCVDDANIVQYNPDIKNVYCWAIGGARYSKLSTSLGASHYGKAKNQNAISIEMCSNKKDKSNLNDNADDWYFTEATIKNTIELTKHLMKTYNTPIENVIMHHSVTGKLCPAMWTRNEASLAGWRSFIAMLKGETAIQQKVEKKTDTTCLVAINGCIKEYKTKNISGTNYIHARSFLEALGYKVGFNKIKKRVMVDNRLTLDIRTILDNGTAYIHLRDTINFLNDFDDFHFLQDKTIRYNADTGVIVIS